MNVPFELNIAGDGPEGFAVKLMNLMGSNQPESDSLVSWGRKAWQRHSLKTMFFLTSQTEGLPMALLEAMSAALCPVVMDILQAYLRS